MGRGTANFGGGGVTGDEAEDLAPDALSEGSSYPSTRLRLVPLPIWRWGGYNFSVSSGASSRTTAARSAASVSRCRPLLSRL
jgi:hypothetical protein